MSNLIKKFFSDWKNVVIVLLLFSAVGCAILMTQYKNKYETLQSLVDEADGDLVDLAKRQKDIIMNLESSLSEAIAELAEAQALGEELDEIISEAKGIVAGSNERYAELKALMDQTGGDPREILERQKRIAELTTYFLHNYEKITEQLKKERAR